MKKLNLVLILLAVCRLTFSQNLNLGFFNNQHNKSSQQCVELYAQKSRTSLSFELSSKASDIIRQEFSDFNHWAELFKKQYKIGYKENKCYQNIINFIDLAFQQKLDLSGGFVVGFENTGGHMFGMVNALYIRNGGKMFDVNTPQSLLNNQYRHDRYPGEENFYHHVVFIKNDLVFDLSFNNEPIILPFKEYIQKMLIPEDKINSKEYINSKLRSYKFTYYDAKLHREYRINKKSTASLEKVYYLPDLLPELFN